MFWDCFVLSTEDKSIKPLSRIAEGIGRYPNTVFLLIYLLKDLKKILEDALFLLAGRFTRQSLEEDEEEEEGGEGHWSSQDFLRLPGVIERIGIEDEEVNWYANDWDHSPVAFKLREYYDDVMGLVMTLCTMKQHVCPPRGSSVGNYHGHSLEAFERGLVETIWRAKEAHGAKISEAAQQDKEHHGAGNAEAPVGGTGGGESDSPGLK